MQLKKHSFEVVIDSASKILILGSLPSTISVERGFYYMHPQNRFWKILSSLYSEDAYTMNIEEKKRFILKHHLALYDVIESCRIENSSDQSICDVKVQDLHKLLMSYPIERVVLNGDKAYSLFIKYYPNYKDIAVKVPSTSSANAGYSLEKLIEFWRKALF